MGTIDLRELDGDHIVIHYGGALKSVDAYTFANSLIAFADTIRSVNNLNDPNLTITVRVEAVGPGSFRAVIKKAYKGLGGFFSRGAENLLWASIAWLIFDRVLADDPKLVINISEEMVVIERGNDKIIIPRAVYDNADKLKSDPTVIKHLNKTFEVVAKDEAIENFGITKNVDDETPLVQVDRADFPKLMQRESLLSANLDRREQWAEAILIILKAWLTSGDRKWSFEWNGVPISAPVKDDEFWSKIDSREYLIGSGDALRVTLKYHQEFDAKLNVWVNDQSTFEVVQVMEILPRNAQIKFD